MRKDSNMNSNNNLDKYFTQAQKAENPESLFSENELRSITEKGYSGGKLNPITQILKILKRNKIMTISSLIIASSIVWFSFTVNDGISERPNDRTTERQNNEEQKTVNNTQRTENREAKTEKHNTVFNELVKKSVVLGFEDVLNNPDAFPLLKLTDSELEKIGLKKVGLNYEFIIEHSMIGKTYGDYFENIMAAGYDPDNTESLVRTIHIIDTTGTKKEVIPDQGFTIYRASKMVPYCYISNQDEHIQYGDMGLAVYFRNPYTEDRYNSYLASELRVLQNDQWGFRDYSMQKKDFLILENKYYPMIRKLIPVFIHYGSKNAGSDAIFWYLPTQEFFDGIPERYQEIINAKYDKVEKIVYSDEMKKIKLKDTSRIPFKIHYNNGIRFVYFDAGDEWVRSLEYFDNKTTKIGTVEISYEDLRKIRYRLKKEIEKYNPPSIDILTFENDTAKFERLLRKAVDNAAGNYSEVAKVQLYSYICKTFAYDIQGIEEIELNDEELEGLGIISDENGYHGFRDVIYNLDQERKRESHFKFHGSPEKVVYLTRPAVELNKSEYDTTIRNAYYRNMLDFNSTQFTERLIKYTGWDLFDYIKVHPIATTMFFAFKDSDLNFFRGILMAFESSPLLKNPDSLSDNYTWRDAAFSSMVNKFIPIKLFIPKDKIDTTKDVQYKEYTLWYVLNKDFINALPERYQESLSKELELITGIEEGTIPAEAACDAIKGKESYLDLCRYESDAIKDLKVYPNPNSTKEVKLQFKLSKRCNIRIDIHDLSGRLISNVGNLPCAPGEQNLIFEFRKFIPSQGVYLISITTNTGEQVVRRFIVE
ncbi:T9SS type A sorting domain-containing protein [Bacteroidota bacterium]